MRVLLQTWLIGDGQIPDLATGDLLADVSLWFTAAERTASSGSDSIGAWHGPGSDSTAQIDGTVEWSRTDPELALVRAGGVRAFVEGPWKQVGDPHEMDFELNEHSRSGNSERVDRADGSGDTLDGIYVMDLVPV